MYANFIRILQFGEWFDGSEYRSEFEWHHELLSLQFPQLQTVRFFKDDSATGLITGHALVHYAQPNLVEFYVATGIQLSDAFLDTLLSKCPRLIYLCLYNCADNKVTGEGLVRFLHGSRQLRALRIRHIFDNLWSEDVFRIIEQLPNLHAVGLPLIEESWLEEITGFQAPTSLHASISNRGLALLTASLPYLLEAQLQFQSLRPSLSVVAGFTRLTSLELNFSSGSSFDAQHLLLIARCCSDLRFCPELEDLILGPINIKGSEIQADAGGDGRQTVVSNGLWGLHFVLHQDQHPLPFDEELVQDQAQSDSILQIAGNLASLFPSLSAFSLEGDGKREGEWQLWKEVTKRYLAKAKSLEITVPGIIEMLSGRVNLASVQCSPC
ncbi:unnamed protein product [Clonostachys chloroleuca]|uniref:Uncharacterized protein n=1 Tax=Clonostachys chloroleuca TaxID=1926264 RepID=A0AA35LU70_9HYPO|nr:unnamed protein product [Clonostachys chloroleuca]